MTFAKKSLLAAIAALSIGTAMAPNEAEARWRGGYGGAIAAGIVGGALLGAFATRPAYGYYGYGPAYYAPTYYAPAYAAPACYTVRQRVWSDYRGRFVRVRRTICD